MWKREEVWPDDTILVSDVVRVGHFSSPWVTRETSYEI